MRHHVANTYRQDQVRYASPLELVLLLYDKAILLLKGAAAGVETGDMIEKGETLSRATEIIAELQAVLDMQQGGEIARNLEELYGYMLRQLTKANYENDVAKITEVVRLLEELREGWRGIAKTKDGKTP